MSGNVVPLSARNAEQAWATYVGLLDQLDERPDLRRNMAFNMLVVRAWREFRDALIAEGRA